MSLNTFLPQQSSERRNVKSKESELHFIPKNSKFKTTPTDKYSKPILESDINENANENDYEFGPNVQQYNFDNLGITPKEM